MVAHNLPYAACTLYHEFSQANLGNEAIELFEAAIQWGICTAQPTVATWCQTFERYMRAPKQTDT